MQVLLEPGHYIAAVSGGVDSMVLLDLLRKRPGIKLTVAHLDHGIRLDSHLDRQLVESIAKSHGLPFVHHRESLGSEASEALARDARYTFLKKVRDVTGAKAIITAHHQDDRLETAVHNMLRGSGRRGYTPLKSTDGIIRPLVQYPKQRLIDYAKDNQLVWREDSTNTDTRYKRNYIRHNVLSQFSDGRKAQLNILLERLDELNKMIDVEIVHMLHIQDATDRLDRDWFTSLPHRIATELMHAWLLRAGVNDITEKMVERLVHAAKTASSGKRHMISGQDSMHITDKHLKYNRPTG